jgi:undecaprenyl-diphosphatase
MTVLQGIALGVLQGLTEFLPVSSSGHLALAESFFGIESPGVAFEVFVHFGTAIAVICFFRHRIIAIIGAVVSFLLRREHDADEARLGLHLLIGTIPAALIGYFLADRVEAAFGNPALVSSLLIVTGCILWATRRLREGERPRGTWKDALAIGSAQALAILPGISRSGSTIAAGLAVGLTRRAAAEFAFLLSVPVILGATAVSLGDAVGAADVPRAAIAAGTVASFLAAIPAIAFLLKVVEAGRFSRFAWYCWGVGIIGLVASFMGS